MLMINIQKNMHIMLLVENNEGDLFAYFFYFFRSNVYERKMGYGWCIVERGFAKLESILLALYSFRCKEIYC